MRIPDRVNMWQHSGESGLRRRERISAVRFLTRKSLEVFATVSLIRAA